MAEEVEKRIASDYAAQQRETLAIRRKHIEALREVDAFREALKGQHAKIEALLEILVDLPIAKAMVRDPETGHATLDPTMISDRDAKVALSAVEKILKVTGALAPPKIDVEVHGGSAFELLDAVEVSAEDA